MFERYTERARRVIFFARYETSNFGSRTIETEHLLLGLLREETTLLLPGIHDEIRAKINARTTTTREKIPTSMDLPLSEECLLILKYSGEEADNLSQSFVGTEHLLLGMLRETGCVAAKLLREAGVSLDTVRETVKSMPAVRPLTRLPPLHGGLPGQQEIEGRNSSVRRTEDGAIVVETTQVLGPYVIFVEERFQRSPDGKKLQYIHEVTGPRQQRHVHSYDFDVS